MADHDPTTVDPDVLLAHVIAIQGHVSQAIPATPATDRHLRYAYGLLTQLADAIRDLRAAGRLLPEGGQTREEWDYRGGRHRRLITTFPDHSQYRGPWEPVPDTTPVPDLAANLRASLERAKEARAAVPDTDGGER